MLAQTIDGGAEWLPLHLLNEQNRQLTGEITHYEGEVETVLHEVEDHKERLRFMQDHLGNVKAEIINTQGLVEAKRRELESEDHMCQLAERERGRLKQRIQQMDQQRDFLQEKLDMVQNRLFQSNLRMDEYKAALQFNQEELDQWDLARRQKEADEQAIEQYAKVDTSKVKALELQIERTVKANQNSRDLVDKEVAHSREAQIELDKCAEDYRKLHQERQRLLAQWEEAVKAMHLRDNAIKASGDRYNEGRAWLEKRKKQLKARTEYYEAEVAATDELNTNIAQQDRVLGKYREDFGLLEKHLRDMDEEVDVMKSELSRAVTEKGTFTKRLRDTKVQIEVKQQQYAQTLERHQAATAKLQGELDAANDLETQNQLVEKLLVETQQHQKNLERETDRIKNEIYKHSQLLHHVRRQQGSYMADIAGSQSQGKNLNAKIAQLDGDAARQQELLYHIEFNIQQMERKVNRVKGERTEEEKKELQEKIRMLQNMYDDLLKQHKVLDTQVKRVKEELRKTKHEKLRMEGESKKLGEQVLELNLETDSCLQELRGLGKQKEDALVGGDVHRLQVERLKKLLHMQSGELHGLENRKQQLDITIAEREAEIAMHHDMLRVENKTAEEERKRVAMELIEREKLVRALRSRYENLIGRMDQETGQMSHAQIVVRAAKEREELQNTGDALDGNIKKAEHDLLKIEKTIAVLRGSNLSYKQQFSKVKEGDEELLQQKLLKEKNKELQKIVNRRTNESRDYLQMEMTKLNEMQDRQRELAEMEKAMQRLDGESRQVAEQVAENSDMVNRFGVAIDKAQRSLEPEIASDILLLDEKESHEAIVRLLIKLGQSYGEELHRIVEGSLVRHNIPLPSDQPNDYQVAAAV